MRFELTTSTLARLRSTPELRPQSVLELGVCPSSAADNTHDRGQGKPLFLKKMKKIHFFLVGVVKVAEMLGFLQCLSIVKYCI